MKFSFCLLFTAALAAAAPPKINIPIEKYKLDNGLRVILSEDNTLPVVAVYVVYDVG
jgi:predicted Zn-dependent peptidase